MSVKADGSLLSGIRVVEFAGELVGYAGKLFASLGASVVKVAAQDRRENDDQVRANYLDGEKGTAQLELDPQAVERHIREADIVLVGDPARIPLPLTAINPRLIVVSVTPFGLSGPRRDQPSEDLITQATSGLLSQLGLPARPPTRIPGQHAWDTAAAAGAIGALLALRVRQGGGPVCRVEVSAQETLIAATESAIGFCTVAGMRRVRSGDQTFFGATTSYRCSDGRVVGNVARRWDAFLDWRKEAGLPVPTALREPPWDDFRYRLRHQDDVDRLIEELFDGMTGEQIAEAAQRRRIVMAPIRTVTDLLADRHLAARGFFLPVESRPEVRQPGRPFRFRFGDRPDVPPGGKTRAESAGLPLAGLRVLDLGTNVAIPYVGKLLALNGAEVIKVESTRHLDALRTIPMPQPEGSTPGGTINWLWASVNAGKRSIALDLATPAGREVMLALVRRSDVVMDNFGVDPLPKWRLTFDDLRSVKPDILLLRSSVQGRFGPAPNAIGNGSSISALSGLTALSGFPDDDPISLGPPYLDFTASALHALFALLAALRHRETTGQGAEIDCSQVEAALALLGPEVIRAQVAPAETLRQGNRRQGYLVHGVFPCLGNDRWCAIAIRTESSWRALVDHIGRESETLGRRIAGCVAEDEREQLLGQWTSRKNDVDVEGELRALGIAAGVVQDAFDLVQRDSHLAERGYFYRRDQPALGPILDLVSPIRLEGLDGQLPGPAPLLGEQTDAILTELGYGEDAINTLYVQEVLA